MKSVQHTKSGPLKTFYDLFHDHLIEDDQMEFFAKRTNKGKDTYLHMDIYKANNLSTIFLEDYSLRDKLNGYVIIAFPTTEIDIPIFTLQLGGNGDKSIALLDISPTLPNIDYAPLESVYQEYSERLGLGPSNTDWVTSICSPYLLHCQYGSLDEAVFLDAMKAYLTIWIEHYYKRGKALTTDQDIQTVTNAIYKFKHVVHANDPAYKAFSREWGTEVADAFLYLETRDHPALTNPGPATGKIPPWENKDLNILWTSEAQERAMEAPDSVQDVIRNVIERKAAEQHIGLINLDVFEQLKESPGSES